MHCHEDSWNHREQPKPVSRQKYSYKMYYCPKSENLNLQRFGHFALCRVLRSGTTVSGLSMASPDDGSDGLPDSDDEGGERRRKPMSRQTTRRHDFFVAFRRSCQVCKWNRWNRFTLIQHVMTKCKWKAMKSWVTFIYWIALDFFFCRDTSFLQDVISRTKCKWNIGGN